MDDLPEKLRALYVAYGTNYVQAAANEIESLRQRLADKHRLFMCASANYDRLAEQLAECEQERDELVAALKAVQHVANESTGVIGWHLNGDIATWDELLPEVDAALAKLGADKMGEGS